MQQAAPEERELEKKRRILERLKDRLADREEEVIDIRGDLERFEARYSMEVGRLYAQQDEIDAEIAEEELKLVPDDEEIKRRVEELRRIAEESAARLKAAEEHGEFWEPTPEAKKAYHNIARAIHPDLALDDAEKERRHGLMAELNEAYSSGDQQKLNKLVEEYRVSPDLVKGDSIGDELVRAIRQIAQIHTRLKELQEEKHATESSELFDLYHRAEAEAREGRDLLRQMAERARSHILKSERRLLNLKNVTAAQEEHVKETYGMDIKDFREGN